MEQLNGAIDSNQPIGLVRPTDIVQEMQGAYLDYAMSVIVARALPDVRDGLKPVHRRILYAMHHDLGLDHTKPHKKSARVVGEVLGKYHPHGETAVYDAMVRMAQEFSLRYPLIDGQGNFGSVDGDNAAAMRYTEARLAEISSLMLADLEKETVEWHDNFDNTLLEPDVLPAALPNLLINGASGIAVGMATNVPPHNLGEVVDALAYVIDHYDKLDDVTVEQLMHFIQGPDFPTGGILYRYREEGKEEEHIDVIAQGYSVGKARLVIQAKAHFEEMSRGRSRIVVTEIPYQTNKSALIERIAFLARDGKIEGITDLRDESDRTGMRIVIELTRNVEPKTVLADLFKLTPLQQTFGMQLLALVDGEPRTLGLKRILQLFVQHRQEVMRRRSEFELARARERAHILEGLLRALDILDEVISTIRRSQNAETARTNLVRDFHFTEIQAQAILDMQLRRLAALERKKLQDEHKELKKQIAYLEELLANPAKMLAVIKSDLLALREKYADGRRTQIVDRTKGTLTTTDLLPDQEVWVTVGGNGELRRQDAGRTGAPFLRQLGKHAEVALLTANTRDFLYLFARDGRCRRAAIHELPQDGAAKHLAELTDFTRRDEVTAALALPRLGPAAPGYLFLVTEQGVVKRITLSDFLAAAAGSPSVMAVDAKDRLIAVLRTQGGQEVILVTAEGQSIRFSEEDVRSMGLAAGGVGGIKLAKGDKVVHAAVVEPQGELLTMTEQGFAKRTPLEQYSSQGRNGGGIVTHKLTPRTGRVVAALMVGVPAPETLVMISNRSAVHVVELAETPSMGRGVQGKAVVELASGQKAAAVHAAGSTPHGGAPASLTVPVAEPSSTVKPPSTTLTNGAKANGATPRTRATPVATEPRRDRSSKTQEVTAAQPKQAAPAQKPASAQKTAPAVQEPAPPRKDEPSRKRTAATAPIQMPLEVSVTVGKKTSKASAPKPAPVASANGDAGGQTAQGSRSRGTGEKRPRSAEPQPSKPARTESMPKASKSRAAAPGKQGPPPVPAKKEEAKKQEPPRTRAVRDSTPATPQAKPSPAPGAVAAGAPARKSKTASKVAAVTTVSRASLKRK
jgi:DNA gyrase subunit A